MNVECIGEASPQRQRIVLGIEEAARPPTSLGRDPAGLGVKTMRTSPPGSVKGVVIRRSQRYNGV